MRCDTCKGDADLVMRVVIAKDYNRALAKPIFNCVACFERKEQTKTAQGSRLTGMASSREQP